MKVSDDGLGSASRATRGTDMTSPLAPGCHASSDTGCDDYDFELAEQRWELLALRGLLADLPLELGDPPFELSA